MKKGFESNIYRYKQKAFYLYLKSIFHVSAHYGSSIEFKLCEFHYPDASFIDKHNAEKTHSLETFYYNLDRDISR